jgi:hypothetical protein
VEIFVFLLFNGEMGSLSWSGMVESTEPFSLWESRSPGTHRVADYHSVEELGSHSLTEQ